MEGAAEARGSHERTHVVLVPGFGGFDALGQVEYYAGVTELFEAWSKAAGKAAVLHYFDNFPTAGVETRAARLARFLAKRMVRGQIAAGDPIVLVGHSTGGLDIRQLVLDLDGARLPVVADGRVDMDPGRILPQVRRVVFLSVPHWGTNIADWVRSHKALRERAIADLRKLVAGSQVRVVDRIEEWLAGRAYDVYDADLLLAVQDALSEANEANGCPGPMRTAEAHEAASELALYLRHMASDFRVIDDLTVEPAERRPRSPAHLKCVDRRREQRLWNRLGIDVLTYATVADPPFPFVAGKPAPVWQLADPCAWREITAGTAMSSDTDITYRLCYRACAGGPFQIPHMAGQVTSDLTSSGARAIQVWDNDGIVNTASMLWPRGPNVLVSADHLDIVGHYQLTRADPRSGRRYLSYDALKSCPRFTDEMFTRVWTDVFRFAVGLGRATVVAPVGQSSVTVTPQLAMASS